MPRAVASPKTWWYSRFPSTARSPSGDRLSNLRKICSLSSLSRRYAPTARRRASLSDVRAGSFDYFAGPLRLLAPECVEFRARAPDEIPSQRFERFAELRIPDHLGDFSTSLGQHRLRSAGGRHHTGPSERLVAGHHFRD